MLRFHIENHFINKNDLGISYFLSNNMDYISPVESYYLKVRKAARKLANFEQSFTYWRVIAEKRSIAIHKDIFPIITRMLEETKDEDCWNY